MTVFNSKRNKKTSLKVIPARHCSVKYSLGYLNSTLIYKYKLLDFFFHLNTCLTISPEKMKFKESHKIIWNRKTKQSLKSGCRWTSKNTPGLRFFWSSFWKLMQKLFSFLWVWGQSIFMKQSSGCWKPFLSILYPLRSEPLWLFVMFHCTKVSTGGWWCWNSSSHVLVQPWGKMWLSPSCFTKMSPDGLRVNSITPLYYEP